MNISRNRYALGVEACALSLIAALLSVPASAAASSIHGVVENKTTGKPATHEQVSLMSLNQGMQEIAHTITDGQGRYSFELPDRGAHLLKVDHEKASYYASVPASTDAADVDVYDVSDKLSDVVTKAAMLRIETDAQGLHVVQSYFVDNDSKPARTQLGPDGYEIQLPAAAQIDASEAMGPGGMPVSAPPVPGSRQGRYSYVFPLRPGETRFEVSYHVPYTGSYSFRVAESLATENFVVALPKSMKFEPSDGTGFEPLNDEADAQAFLIKAVEAEVSIAFAVSGSGSFPPDPQDQGNGSQTSPQDSSGQGSSSVATSTADTQPGMGLGAPSGGPNPLEKYKWWILTECAVLFTGVAGLTLRPRDGVASEPATHQHPVVADRQVGPGAAGVMGTLKDELFALESERLRNQVTEGEYAERKMAIELILKHALEREA